MGFEENEISIKAAGGTEIAKRMLAKHIERLRPGLLDNFQIICSRPRELDPSKYKIFWCHDLPEDPESNKFQDQRWLDQFDKIVFISEWQYQRYQLVRGLVPSLKHVVLETGIEWNGPIRDPFYDRNGTIRICYTSTPNRGLALLIPAFEHLSKLYPITLDVFSSFKIYGWDKQDDHYRPLYDKIQEMEGANYRGFTPHDELQRYLREEGHIHAYPSIWMETSCRAMIEAMASGMVCVHPNLAALPHSCGYLNPYMYRFSANNNEHSPMFSFTLERAIQDVMNGMTLKRLYMAEYVNDRYGIEKITDQWIKMLEGVAASKSVEKKLYTLRTYK